MARPASVAVRTASLRRPDDLRQRRYYRQFLLGFGKVQKMCANLFDWLVRFIAIVSFILYLWQLWKRTNQGKLMVGFLLGIKSRDTITSADWPHLARQIDDMLAHLQPPKRNRRALR